MPFKVIVLDADSVKAETPKKQNAGAIIGVASQYVPVVHKSVVDYCHSIA
jgi:hypothetical protein